jgi:ferric-dicitrate binding protein FerR (iron transport regulator)
MKQQEIEQLIVKHLMLSSTNEEDKSLQLWLEESQENKDHFFHLKDLWDARQLGSEESKKNSQKEWNRLNRKLSPKSSLVKRIIIETIKAAAILVLSFGVYSIYQSQSVSEQDQLAVVEVPYGSKTKLFLPDGSEVLLNAGSRLSYSPGFYSGERFVNLTGEGYFKVKHNPDIPFFVNTSEVKVKVLGTEFNVMAYDDFDRVEATLVNGSVSLMKADAHNSEEVILKPGQKAILKNNRLEIVDANLDLETYWTQNKFYFERIAFAELMKRLEKWYDVRIEFNEKDFENLTYTGKFRNEETIWQVLDAIQLTSPIKYTAEHRKVFITLKNEKR